VERLNRVGSTGSGKFSAGYFLRGLALRNTVADAALKLDWSAMQEGNRSGRGKDTRHRYYLEHKERLREVIRLWRENNPERYREVTRKASKNYEKNHSEHCRDYQRQYSLDHSEHIKAQRRQRWLTLHK
jgi:hypothetical protein